MTNPPADLPRAEGPLWVQQIGAHLVQASRCKCKMCRKDGAEMAIIKNGKVSLYHWACFRKLIKRLSEVER